MTDRTQAPAPGTPTWPDLTTPDPAGARAFYGELLGWGWGAGLPGRTEHATAELAGRPVAGVGGYTVEEEGSPAVWTTHLAVDDLDRTLTAVESGGGRIFSGPVQLEKQARVATVSDPEGAVFGLWEAGAHHGVGAVDEPGAFVWAEVWSDDPAATAAFYAALLDLPDELPVMEGMRVVEVGGATAFGIWPAGMAVEAPGTGPHWVTYFQVADADAAAARAVELGGAVRAAPDDSPFGRWAMLSDPHGARFAVVDTSTAAG